jgi:serine/threonine protein kinase
VWVQRCPGSNDGLFDDDREHLLDSFENASRVEFRDSPYIVRAFDRSTDASFDTFVFWELGEQSVADIIRTGAALPPGRIDAIESGMRSALDTIHRAGFVHCDIQPGNILRVGELWKLTDLAGCVRKGDPVRVRPGFLGYQAPGSELGSPASQEIDLWGLRTVLAALRSMRAGNGR